MSSFFKTFFLGILITVLLPLILVLLAIFFVYCLIVFIIMGIRNIIVFFSGGSPNGDLPEDIQAKRIIARKQESEVLKSVEQTYASTPNLEDTIPPSMLSASSLISKQNVSDSNNSEIEKPNPITQNDVVDVSEDNSNDHID